MNKKICYMLALIALLTVPVAWAISTTTLVNFNVVTVVGYTLTLPGEGGVAANSTGAPTTAIRFDSPDGDDSNVNAQVQGGQTQNSTLPIFTFDNTGTVDLNISTVLSSDTPTCINLTGATTYAGADGGPQITSAANLTVVNDYTPSAAAQDWFMKADFTACVAGDSTSRTLTSYGIQS